MPRRRAVLITRQAISPRFATRILSNREEDGEDDAADVVDDDMRKGEDGAEEAEGVILPSAAQMCGERTRAVVFAMTAREERRRDERSISPYDS
jgi:hypothetical protein